MPRDRLAEVKSEAADNDDVTVDVDVDVESEEKFMASFYKQIKEIRDNIAKIEKSIEQVERKNADLIVAVGKTNQKEISDAINKLNDDISTTSNRVRVALKKLDDENKKVEQESRLSDQDPSNPGLGTDLRVRKSQHLTLTRNFMRVMSHFSELQAQNKMKQREMVKRQCKIVDPNITDETIDNVIENGTENIFSGKRLAEAEAALSDIQERHQELLKLQSSLMELHTMFLDLSIMIDEQGEMIDRIEFNVSSASNYVEKAQKELKQAVKAQSAARKKQVLIAICCLILAGVILAAIIAPIRAVR